MSDPVPIKSQTRDIVERMYEWLDDALAVVYDEYFITLDVRFDISEAGTFPVIVVDFDEGDLTDVTIGRRLPFSGTTEMFTFELSLYHLANEVEGIDYDRDNQILVRTVIDYLNKKNQNSTEMTDHNIWSVNVVQGRRSDTGIRKISRYILSVEVEVLREDYY
jgi:hypothetical protein